MLAARCGVSKRTVLRDVKLLREAGVGVAYDREYRGYVGTSGEALLRIGLLDDEILALSTLCDGVSQSFLHMPESIRVCIKTAGAKIAAFLSKRNRDRIRARAGVVVVQGHAETDVTRAPITLDILLRAIDERRRVRLFYADLSGRIVTLFSPYRLVIERDTSLAVGRSSWHRKVRDFDVLRIDRAELTEESYSMPQHFNLHRHLCKQQRS
jgi:predicted DNA-binding transcriptional regulator YafY